MKPFQPFDKFACEAIRHRRTGRQQPVVDVGIRKGEKLLESSKIRLRHRLDFRVRKPSKQQIKFLCAAMSGPVLDTAAADF